MLGLAFKPGTGRPAGRAFAGQRSPAAGARRKALLFTIRLRRRTLQRNTRMCHWAGSIDEALDGAFCCFIFTEWDEFVRLSPEVFAARCACRWFTTDGTYLTRNHETRRSGILLHRTIGDFGLKADNEKKILITGAAGFIGYHLANDCWAKGYQIAGVDNLNSYYDPSLKRARLRNWPLFQIFRLRRAIWRITTWSRRSFVPSSQTGRAPCRAGWRTVQHR